MTDEERRAAETYRRGPVITVFGSARTAPDDAMYAGARQVGGAYCKEGNRHDNRWRPRHHGGCQPRRL